MICLWSGLPGFNCWTSVVPAFQSCLLLSTRLLSSQGLILIFMFAFLIHWWVEVLHADRTTSICIRTTTEPRARLLQRKTGLSPTIIYSWPFQGDASVMIYSNRQCSSAFCLSLAYCSIYLGKPSVGKVLSPWLFTCAVFILVPSKLQVSLSRLVFRTGYGIRLYGSWSLPFYLLYLTSLIWNRQHWLCRAIIAT